MIIALDFDGTLVENHPSYPQIGADNGAMPWLQRASSPQVNPFSYGTLGVSFVLHTCRTGAAWDAAVAWRNANVPSGITLKTLEGGIKPRAQLYIDDKGLGAPTKIGANGRPCVDWSAAGPMMLDFIKQHGGSHRAPAMRQPYLNAGSVVGMAIYTLARNAAHAYATTRPSPLDAFMEKLDASEDAMDQIRKRGYILDPQFMAEISREVNGEAPPAEPPKPKTWEQTVKTAAGVSARSEKLSPPLPWGVGLTADPNWATQLPPTATTMSTEVCEPYVVDKMYKSIGLPRCTDCANYNCAKPYRLWEERFRQTFVTTAAGLPLAQTCGAAAPYRQDCFCTLPDGHEGEHCHKYTDGGSWYWAVRQPGTGAVMDGAQAEPTAQRAAAVGHLELKLPGVAPAHERLLAMAADETYAQTLALVAASNYEIDADDVGDIANALRSAAKIIDAARTYAKTPRSS